MRDPTLRGWSGRVSKKGTCEKRSEVREGANVQGSGEEQRKSPKSRVCLVFLGTIKRASGAGAK